MLPQSPCPPAFSPPPSFVCPVLVLIHCFPLSLVFFFFHIPSCLCFNNYSLWTITFYGIISLFFSHWSVSKPFDFFSIHHLKLRTNHTLISLLSSLPPSTSLYPQSRFFRCLTQTTQRQCSLLDGSERHVRFSWNINFWQLMRPHLNIMNQSTYIVLISSDRAESLIC